MSKDVVKIHGDLKDSYKISDKLKYKVSMLAFEKQTSVFGISWAYKNNNEARVLIL